MKMIKIIKTYICDHINTEMGQVENHFTFALFDLRVRCQLCEVFLGNSILDHHVQGDDANFVVVRNGCVKEDGDDVAHVIFDLLTLGVGSHRQILFHSTQLVDVALDGEKDIRLKFYLLSAAIKSHPT